jgi:hypothetical protein
MYFSEPIVTNINNANAAMNAYGSGMVATAFFSSSNFNIKRPTKISKESVMAFGSVL